MAYIPIQDLLQKTNSMYKLVILASKRTAELNAGTPALVEPEGESTSSIALEEIAQGKVKMEIEK